MNTDKKITALLILTLIGFATIFYQLNIISKTADSTLSFSRTAESHAIDAANFSQRAWDAAENAYQTASDANDAATEARDYASNCPGN